MSSRARLDEYLQRTRQRLRLILLSQGAAVLLAVLAVLTLLAALWLPRAGFSDSAAIIARVALAVAGIAVVALFALRWRAMQGNDGGDALERALPAQGGRIQTYLQERRKQEGQASILLDLLAEDAARIAEAEPLQRSVPAHRLWVPGAVALLAFGGVLALLLARGSVGEGARHLWLGHLPPATRIAAAAGGILVKPGDAKVRRNQDLPISAVVAGGGTDAQVHVRFGEGDWEVTPMEPDKKGGYAFTLYAVRDAARYYVTSGRLKSAEHRIEVVDLPKIESLRLTYSYPSWTGLPQHTEEGGGDVRGVAGTRVALQLTTDKPIDSPLLIVNGAQSALAQSERVSNGTLTVKETGTYRIATRFDGEIVPLTGDFAIDVVPDEKPEVQILKPGRDYRATNIEEVPVGIRARDDFRLEALELHYSVNGGDWRSEKLPAGAPDINAAALLRLEEMQQRGANGEEPLLTPGDLVSYYALARDHSSSVQTDLFLIQVQPFDQRYTQSQANGGGGGGGGGGDDQNQISQRQRELLLATWNLQRNQSKEGGRAAERDADSAKMLSEVQDTLADQTRTLVDRAQARQLTGSDQSVTQFVKSLEEAEKSMRPASESLAKQDLETAVKHEQLALQQLLHAESIFREIQVAMRSPNGGGGGGGAQAGRDVSEMTELEMDLAKNQYETQPEMSSQQRGEAEDEALRRLRELARRQEQLAREAARNNTQTEAQRWQQEQLRREAEQLRQQLEQLAQQQRGGQQSGSQQSGGQSGQSSSSASAAAQAARQLDEAMREMQARNGSSDSGAASRASEQLNRAREQLERGQQQASGDRFNDLAHAARDLGDKQRSSEQELRAALAPQAQPPASIARPGAQQRNGLDYEHAQRLAETKRQIQEGLEDLQRQMRMARQQGAQQTPRASDRVGQAARDLEQSDTASRLERSASDIERGRGVQAASREGLITESLDQLQQTLDEAASVAATESGERGTGKRQTSPEDLLAELGDLRRSLERARQQGLAQNNRGGDPGANSPDAREGQMGQGGGRSGQQGAGNQGQGGQVGQGGTQPGGEGGRNAGANGGVGNFGVYGAGPDGGGGGRYIGGLRGAPVDYTPYDPRLARQEAQLSSQRLQQLREQLANGTFTEPDLRAIQELEERLRRANGDPMSTEYPRMMALVNQLELSALQKQQEKDSGKPARGDETIDDSRRYRENVAEYYRRLGGPSE